METYDIHFKNITKDTIQLSFTLHDDKEEEKPEDVIGTVVAHDLPNAKHRLEKLLDRVL